MMTSLLILVQEKMPPLPNTRNDIANLQHGKFEMGWKNLSQLLPWARKLASASPFMKKVAITAM